MERAEREEKGEPHARHESMARRRRSSEALLVAVVSFVVCYGRHPSNAAATPDKDLRPLTQSELSKLLADLLALNPDTADCPAPRVPVPRTRCRAHPCSSDDDCRWNSHRCCFNGCVFTCLPKLAPPPVIDWTKEVRPINASKAPKHFTGIVCSTAPVYAPAAPLQCPEGMVCVTKDVGDPLTGQPSMGECIVDPHAMTTLPSGDGSQSQLESLGSETVFLPGGCILTKEQYKSMEEFKQKPYITGCTCKQGSVECKISTEKSFDHKRPKKR